MSHRLYRWAFEQTPLHNDKPDSTQKLVLIALADYANSKLIAWPSIKSISERTCLSERAVMNAIQRLIDNGFIERKKRFQTSNVYTFPLYISALDAVIEDISAPDAPPYVHDVHPISAPDAQEPSFNHQYSNSSSSQDSDDQSDEPGVLASLHDMFITVSKIPSFGMKPRDVDAGNRMIAAGITPEILENATKELLSNGYKRLTGLASVEQACYIEKGKQERKITPKEERWVEVHK